MTNSSIIFLCGIILGICTPMTLEFFNKEQNKDEININKGKKYIISFQKDTEDPFQEIKKDTVKVLDIKKDYVLWQYNNGIKQSCETRIFKELIIKN